MAKKEVFLYQIIQKFSPKEVGRKQKCNVKLRAQLHTKLTDG